MPRFQYAVKMYSTGPEKRTDGPSLSGKVKDAAERIEKQESIDSAKPSRGPGSQMLGPFNLPAGLLFIATGIGLYVYFQREKRKIEEKRLHQIQDQAVGRPAIGGPFQLVSSTGHPVTDQDLLGSFSLVYFGFTNCPDICPEELDKMSQVVDVIDKEHGAVINPVFVTCDPARDRVPLVAEYIADFHPRMLGLTGSYDDVKKACKSYRVYFSTPPGADPTQDYLVDHSIFFYLMDPEGKFVDAFGKSTTKDEVLSKVRDYVKRWKAEGLPIREADAKRRAASDGRPVSSDRQLFSEPEANPSKPPAVEPTMMPGPVPLPATQPVQPVDPVQPARLI
ncbi:Cu-binding protein [Malassezia psittaci]|uniref:Cu-binding protein n=1 Tax=Malassezia psittaci TaxID=1821823 RepID=A0AAF0JKD8_9BASI|nr:Cu-binding protein [Malassezia psittaci]